MEYEVRVTILDKGFIVEDQGEKFACTNGSELINCLSRIKNVAETEMEEDNE